MISFALAIPHTPWIPERVDSLDRLLGTLSGAWPSDPHRRIFKDREPNWSWSAKLWRWGLETGATHLLQLQDDVIPAPNFWAALTAMIEACPDQIVSLHGGHPANRLIAHRGGNWTQSKAWMVGVGYVIPRAILDELVKYRATLPDNPGINEDDLIGRFCVLTQRPVYHPIPTIIDHDTDVASTYKNDAHLYRKPTVTWRDYMPKEIESVSFWKVASEPPLVQDPHHGLCWFCYNEPGAAGSSATSAMIGRRCLASAVSGVLAPPQKGVTDGQQKEP